MKLLILLEQVKEIWIRWTIFALLNTLTITSLMFITTLVVHYLVNDNQLQTSVIIPKTISNTVVIACVIFYWKDKPVKEYLGELNNGR